MDFREHQAGDCSEAAARPDQMYHAENRFQGSEPIHRKRGQHALCLIRGHWTVGRIALKLSVSDTGAEHALRGQNDKGTRAPKHSVFAVHQFRYFRPDPASFGSGSQ
jgi:hypothetical protein